MTRLRLMLPVLMLLAAVTVACDVQPPTSNDRQREQSERLLQEATSQTGMPAIKNFRERKLLKDILELRDQDGLVTYTYLFSEQTGKLTFFCSSVGYGIPYATQYTSPDAYQRVTNGTGNGWTYVTLPQADPNGLFSPASADGTWVLCSNSNKKGEAEPTYLEPRIVVSPYKLD